MTHDHITRRSFLATFVAGGAALALASCFDSNTGTSTSSSDEGDSGAEAKEVLTKPLDNGYDTGIHHATIEVKGIGTIKLELNATNTPITVSNFARLANAGFYDGLTFHRVIKGFMIQGGDPNGDGTGGSDQRIKGEFSANGVTNAIQHKRGVISMARSDDYNSASSQFFIMQEDSSNLDGQYAAFGRVTSGMEVVDSICDNTPVTDNNGTVEKDNQPVITSIRMTD
ncbi:MULTISPECIES: peptidylprolyl isomerase [Parafannyhessea]|jgi:peptidyl-prolyl cis-trans isomerase B (cyclophilin B)|uniref:Peptidyl-prolyl cis-trans isomerase n=3 Tax=Parafannyhessea umbonata TaxID=604330 RepID=A0A1G6HT52_9ACTN|nr:peptidylprolyl isomerase [Parafannyhessea umbonata]MBM6988701.1 peptidylprolyl isomerase [Parafannyhessea umbonata]MCI6682140.1 peptidylprolyl isomerase [Parafannyhessea umbonata]MDD6359393.1 peptidylprolyl isomerase [Parafannyhessea umbonata]MDD6565469.1 peptidylprolyl isomerase [Parafannyhessea umbonata]MDD6601158.1 peptidylprolyl isomerase [Parafannyhessea umbonata]